MTWLEKLFGWLWVKPKPPIVPPIIKPDPTATDMLFWINKERDKAHLRAYVWDMRLVGLSDQHSKWQAKHDTLTHGNKPGEDGDFETRIKASGYVYYNASENVGYNEQSSEEIVKAWMESDLHRENILGNFTSVGGAVAMGKSGPYWTAIFATPRPK